MTPILMDVQLWKGAIQFQWSCKDHMWLDEFVTYYYPSRHD